MATYTISDVVNAKSESKSGYSIDEVMGKQPSLWDNLNDLGAGMVRGAGSIGATIMTPLDKLALSFGFSNDYIGRTDRREAMDAALRDLGANTDSGYFKGGKLATEIAGTAGVPGVAGNAITKAAPLLSSVMPKTATYLPALGEAVSTGGFRAGNAGMATRIGGGAISGGATAGLADPAQAADGAMIGGAMPLAVKAAALTGKGVRSLVTDLPAAVVGQSTGAGSDAIRTAYQAGKAGNQTFLGGMRGNVPMDDVIEQARVAVQKMGAEKSAQYRAGMSNIRADKTVLDMQPILDSLADVTNTGRFKGVSINSKAAPVVTEMEDIVSKWMALGDDFRTPEGLDALKQKLWNEVVSQQQPGSPGHKAATQVYHSIKDTVTKQAPEYAKVMKDYRDASELINEIQRTFSLGPKAADDTALRKLQSIMRNNVNTNYGNRLNLLKQLEDKGGADLMPALAGQALSAPFARGIKGPIDAGIAGVAALTGHPALLGTLALGSPRLMGEAAYGLGRAAGSTGNATNSVAQGLGLLNPTLLNLLSASKSAASSPAALGLAATAPAVTLSQ